MKLFRTLSYRLFVHRRRNLNILLVLMIMLTVITGSTGLFYFTLGLACGNLLDRWMKNQLFTGRSSPILLDFLRWPFIKDAFSFGDE